MMNIYWPVYKNLEKEIEELTYSIHFDEKNKDTYSSKIADLILRIAVDIESITKDLYQKNGGKKDRKKIRYDFDGFKLLNDLWDLKNKKIVLAYNNIFFKDKEFKPFEKIKNDGSFPKTNNWNAVYQGLKHDRVKNLNKATIKNLIEILGVLFILNLFYRDDKYNTAEYGNIEIYRLLDLNIFSITIDIPEWSIDLKNKQIQLKKTDNSNECIYILLPIKEVINKILKENEFNSRDEFFAKIRNEEVRVLILNKCKSSL